MFTKALTLVAFVASSLAISISGPSDSLYWVQFSTNNITWSISSGDPNPVDITITNPNDTFLNGPFSIARNVDLNNGTNLITTNITLKVDTGYVVNFVNATNQTQVFASSGPFEVKAPGTAHAAGSGQSSNSSSSGGSNGNSTSGGGSNSTNSTGSGSGGNSTAKSGAISLAGGFSDMRILASLGLSTLVAFSGVALTL